MFNKILLIAILLSLLSIVVACAGSATSAATVTPPAVSNPPSTPASASPTPIVKQPVVASTPKPAGKIKGIWINATVNGTSVSIPVSEVEKDWNTHFKVETKSGTTNFMAYLLDGKIYVRANVCPPCGSIGYSLDNTTLICDRCATEFNAITGKGIKGACVDFPKESVAYTNVNGNLVMTMDDLIRAYQETIKQG